MRPPSPQDIHCGRALAPGETILWEGRPSWRGLLVRAFHARLAAGYFALVLLLGIVDIARGRLPWTGALAALVPASLTILLLAALAALVQRSTRYVLTSDRVIMRYGVAFPRSLSLPFRQIARLAVVVRPYGSGDVALCLAAANAISFAKLWPHARPWRLSRPEPMLRDIAGAGIVATQLARLLQEAEQRRIERPSADLPEPETPAPKTAASWAVAAE